jgi:hypothetical protein
MTKFGFKEITPNNWLEPDGVLRGFVKLSPNGKFTLVGEDYLNYILRPNLHESVPSDVQALFEVARGAMAYGYFFYPLFTLAMEQLFRVAEAAVAHKFSALKIPKSTKKFEEKIDWLVNESIIPQSESALWHVVRHLRNMASHPEKPSILPPNVTIDILDRVASDINSLFNNKSLKTETK